MPTLYLQTPTAGTVAYQLDRPRVIIGPGQADIPVAERVHLALDVAADGNLLVTDIGPGNLLFAGQPVARHVVRDGDVLAADDVRLQVRLVDGAPCTMGAPGTSGSELTGPSRRATSDVRPHSDVAPPPRSSRRVAAAPPPPRDSERRPRPSGIAPPPSSTSSRRRRASSVSGRQGRQGRPSGIRSADGYDEPRAYPARRRSSGLVPAIVSFVIVAIAAIAIAVVLNQEEPTGDGDAADGETAASSDAGEREPEVVVIEQSADDPDGRTDESPRDPQPGPGADGSANGGNAAPDPTSDDGGDDDEPERERRFTGLSDVLLPMPGMDYWLVMRVDMNRSADEIADYLEEQYLVAVQSEYRASNRPFTDADRDTARQLFRTEGVERVRCYLRTQEAVDSFIRKKDAESRRAELEKIAADLLEVTHGDWAKTDRRLWIVLSAVYNGHVVRLEEPTKPGQAERPRNVSPLGKFQFGLHGHRGLMQIEIDQPLRPQDFSRAFEINAEDLRQRAAAGEAVSDDELQTRRIESDQALRRVQQLLSRVRRTLASMIPRVHRDRAELLLSQDPGLQGVIDRAARGESVETGEIRELAHRVRDTVMAERADD